MNILLIIYFVSVVVALLYVSKLAYNDWSNGLDITCLDILYMFFIAFAPIVNTLFILCEIKIRDWTVIKGKEKL